MKKTYYFKIFALLCCFALLLSLSAQIPAYAEDSLPDTSGVRQAYLLNVENDTVLFSKGATDSSIAPASTVKIMSGLIAIKHLESRLEERITINYDMLNGVEGFTVNFKIGDKIRIKDLLYGLICGGGNDAAMILANVCSGSVGAFVEEMNTEARSLGMTGTKYANPTGIDASGMVTTLEDTVRISKKAISTSLFVEISSVNEYSYTVEDTGEVRTIANRNPLISGFSAIGYKNKYAKGLNAGMTNSGGYCISAYATNGDESYLCVVMGGSETPNGKITAYTVANGLLNYAFNNYTYAKIASKGDAIGRIGVDLALPTSSSDTVTVRCVLEDDIYAYAPKNIDYKRDLTYKVYYHNEVLTAPVEKNTVVGGVEIFFKDKYIASARLVAEDDVAESQLLVILQQMKALILSRTAFTFIIISSALILLYLYLTVWRKKAKKKRAILREIKK